MKVTVYTKPQCVQCEYTKKLLDKQKTPYQTVDLPGNDEARAALAALGYESPHPMPVVVVTNGKRSDHWAGFKIDMLKGLKRTGNY